MAKAKKFSLFKENRLELPAVKIFDVEKELVVGKHGIRWISSEMTSVIAGLVERNVPAAKLQQQELAGLATTRKIAKAIGKRGIVSLAHFAILLSAKQESFWIIVKIKGKVWIMCAIWDAGFGWDVDADPVGYPLPWGVGKQVLSRKSAAAWFASRRIGLLVFD